MTQAIEDLIAALTISEWPGRNPYSQCAWEKFSWPSKKSLLPQYADMIKRHGQLTSWTETLATPISVWLSGFSWPSKKSLLPQYADMIKRHGQLTSWTETLATPISVWLSGLFNPMAYLTSILQVTA